MSGFGAGLGTVIGSSIGAADLNNAQNGVNGNASNFENDTGAYDQFGQSQIGNAGNAINNIAGQAGNVQSYNDFLKTYQESDAAKYQEQQGAAVQNNSAAAKGGLLSGANERSLTGISQGIASQDANQAYGNYLTGNNQAFGQLEQSLGNMFSAMGIGETATGQDASVVNGQNSATANIAGNQAKNDQAKGSGLGSMFGGLGSMAAAF